MSEARSIGILVEGVAAMTDDPEISARLRELVDHLESTVVRCGTDEVLERMARQFGLSRFECDLILAAGLPEEHELIAYALRRLHPSGAPRVSFGVAAELLDLGPTGRTHLRRALSAGLLKSHALVTLEGAVPMPEQSLHLMPGLWSVMRGVDQWPEGLAPTGLESQSEPLLDPARLRYALDLERPLVLVTGHRSRSAQELAAVAIAGLARVGRTPAAFPSTQVVDATEALISAHCVARDMVPVLIGDNEGPPLSAHPGPVVLCAGEPSGLGLDDRAIVTFDVGERGIGENVAMWAALAPELNGGATRLAGLLRIVGQRAARAAADARVTTAGNGVPLALGSILAEVRRRAGGELPASVVLHRPTVDWDRLVTTGRNGELLRSIVDRVDHQTEVLHEWGFGDARNSAGVRAMFAGPPGTGKTLAAEVIAGSLGLDLLVVDLSALVSKWLGETEKNISEVFDAAERTNAVLFFDEADAIFAKRTDAGDAQGRWANLETAHLLTRMEQSRGLVVLATNLRGNIDDAFVRRLDVIVEFDAPGRVERAELWRTHLPSKAPIAADVDVEQLADLYEVTGGVIRNASMDAAFRSAAEGSPIDQQRLILAIEREFQKAGRSFPGIPRSLAVARRGGN